MISLHLWDRELSSLVTFTEHTQLSSLFLALCFVPSKVLFHLFHFIASFGYGLSLAHPKEQCILKNKTTQVLRYVTLLNT